MNASFPARPGDLRALIPLLALAGAACGGGGGGGATPPLAAVEALGSAQGQVGAALADLPSAGAYAPEVIDLSTATEAADGVRDAGVRLGRSGDGGFRLVAPETCDPDAPVSCTTLGSRAHARLAGTGEVRFDAPRRVLGVHLSLSRRQAEALRTLAPESSGTTVLQLPELHVLVTALHAGGEAGATVRAIPAAATYAETRVDDGWRWLDLSVLGEVSGLRFTVESPIDGISTVLVDNLTTSADFRPADDFFTIALLPDTQKYSETEALTPLYDAQTAWLAGNVATQHLVFVSHLGDIVEHGDVEAEWARADAAMQALDGEVPYGVVVGNHDYVDPWNHPEDGAPRFLAHFPASRFAAYPWFLGTSPGGLGSAQLFPTPAGDLLYLHLPVDSPPPTVAWAQSVLDAHPGVPTLVTTHAYLRESGRLPVPYLTSVAPGAWTGISADELFRTLIAPNDQIVMVTCGHVSAEYHQTSTNQAGHPVYELLQDYQNRVNGGEGFLRLLRFHPALKQVRVFTYSPGLDTWEMDDDSRFSLELDLATRVAR